MSTENSNPEYFKSKKEEDQFSNLIEYTVEHAASSDDLRDAYFTVCGTYEGEELSDNAKIIAEKMQELINNGFPLNRFARLIDSHNSYEHADDVFFKFVESLDITAREKELLKSLLLRKRSGALAINIADEGTPFAVLRISITPDIPDNQIGYMLKHELQNFIETYVQDKKIELSFEED